MQRLLNRVPVRVRAFLVHLTCSAAMALVALCLVFLVWYPAPLHSAVGVTGIFLLLLGVDVILGPVLTLIVYRQGKKTLRFDLTCIVVVQLLAFAYGMYTVAEGRPVWLVFAADRFDLVRANEIDERALTKTRKEYQNPSWFGPQWVAARLPQGSDERNRLTLEAAIAGVDMPQRPDLYAPLQEEAQRIREKSFPLEKLLRYNPPEAVVATRARWPQADAWLPMMSRAKPVTVLLNKKSAEVVAVVDLKPWD